jgi:hypothetical protein
MDQLILFQKSFFEIENFEYFTEEWPLLTNTFFRLKKIWFHEHQNGNYYLICKSWEGVVLSAGIPAGGHPGREDDKCKGTKGTVNVLQFLVGFMEKMYITNSLML